MRSPFPGMDPYLEDEAMGEFQHAVRYPHQLLLAELRDVYEGVAELPSWMW
jgi:hypothetical protein